MEPKELNEKEENQENKEKPKENTINNKVKSTEIKEDKKHRHDEDKKVKKRGPRRKKIDNDNIIKISKRKINFSDLEKKYPIKYPVLLSPEQIDKMAIKKGKNKIKKMVKLTNFGKNQNHENNNNNKIEIHKKRGRPPAINISNHQHKSLQSFYIQHYISQFPYHVILFWYLY